MPRTVLRAVSAIAFLAAFALVATAVGRGGLDIGLRQWLLTCAGTAISAALTDFLVGAFAERALARWLGVVACAVSLTAFVMLVWGWATEPVVWRLWWISGLGSLLIGHLGRLRMLRGDRVDTLTRAAPPISIVAGVMLMGLALRPADALLGAPHPVYLGVMLTAFAATGIISAIHWRRRVALSVELDAVLRRSRPAITAGMVLGAFAIGHYVGRVSTPPPTPIEGFPSALRGLSSERLRSQTDADLARLRGIVGGLDDLLGRAEAEWKALRVAMKDGGRTRYTPAEEDRIRRLFVSYLAYRTALLRLVATYGGFETVADPVLRARCFLVGYAAGMTVFEHSLRMVNAFWDDEALRRKLDEAEPRWNLRAGSFEMLYRRVTSERNRTLATELGAYFSVRREEWRRAGVWPPAEYDWIARRINQGAAYVRERSVAPAKAWLELLMARVRDDAYTPVYATQSLVSAWLGDTRVIELEPLIRVEQIEQVAPRLQPGDIILERRNWFLSNAFLPGFWPHSAIYVGTIDDLKRLGIAERPEIARHLEAYLKPGEHGHVRTIVEAVSEGVIFNTLEHSLHADHVAVLRPRLTEAQKAEAIVRAFSHAGKPYDFEFDFSTSDKLVCTELVYRSYSGMLDLPLVTIMGRETLPAIEIARLFASQRDRPDRQLDFVLFLDGDPRAGRAKLADLDAFCASIHRPQAFHR